MSTLLIFCLIAFKYVYAAQTVKVPVECARQCTCTEKHISDLPMMKWHRTPLNRDTKLNESLILNRVHDDEEEELEERNILVNAAICVFQEDSHQIRADQFFPQIEALTILYGRDTVNKTIEYELSGFEDLLALDIQGYENLDSSPNTDVSLHSNALLHLQNLRFLNIEHVFLFPNPNTTSDDGPTIDQNNASFEQLEHRRSELEQRRSKVNLQLNTEPNLPQQYQEYTRDPENSAERRSNITFAIPEELGIVPYEQYKKQQNLISTFSHLSGLQFLRLYRCHLETITWDMFKDLINLEVLSLEGNDLEDIPKLVFFSMPHLKTLVLAKNRLLRLEWESLAGLLELQHLDLSGNKLHYLSEVSLAPFPSLQYLDTRGNPIEAIYSNTFEVMNSTKILFLGSGQPLGIHANAFHGLNSLQRLVIGGLQVESLNGDLLRGMPRLKYLEINGRIDTIEFDAFTDSLELEVLILRNCSLQYLSVDSFFALFQLKVLDLSSNQLEMLTPGIFDQLDSLKDLILSHNRLAELPHVLDGLQHVRMLRLEGNPWRCSCDMVNWRSLRLNRVKELREVDLPCTYKYDKVPCQTRVEDFYVTSSHVLPRCSSPPELEGHSIPHVLKKMLRCPEKRTKVEEQSTAEVGGGQKTKRQQRVLHKYRITAEHDSDRVKNENYESEENVDNNLHDLEQFINPAELDKINLG